MKKLLLVFICLGSYSVSASHHFKKLKGLEEVLNGSYPVELRINGKTESFQQKLQLENCQLKIQLLNEFGVIGQDTYNLQKLFVRKNLLLHKGSYAINFGLKSKTHRRMRLYFNEKKKFKKTEKLLSRAAFLCKKRTVKKIVEKQLKEINEVIGYSGSIPLLKSDNFKVRDEVPTAILNGSKSFYERIQSIHQAKSSLYIQTLIFRGDLSGRYLADLLMKRKQEGIDIKIIVDGLIGNFFDIRPTKIEKKNTAVLFNNLMASGIRVFGYSCSPYHIFKNEVRGWDIGKLIRRNHEKIWIKDKDMAILGGINITNGYFELYGRDKTSIRDIDMAVKGDIVQDIYNSFMINYSEKKIRYKSFKNDKCLNPYNPLTQKDKYLAFRNKNLKPYFNEKDEERRRLNKVVLKNIDNIVNNLPLTAPTLEQDLVISPVEYKYASQGKYIFMRPEEGERQIYPTYLEMIKKAKKEIIVPNAFFVPFESFKKEVMKAANRGVSVKILTNSKKSNDKPIHAIVGRTHYLDFYEGKRAKGFNQELLRKNIEIYEFQGHAPGKEMIRGLYHTKFMVVDRKVSILGSYNITASSENNAETAIVFEGDELAEDLHFHFDNDLKLSKKLDLQTIRKFKKPENFGDALSVLFLKHLFKGFL
ncbi:MAG: phospholipase D-like domain-containing protein [Bacteriovoracaceae bacterium]